MSSLLRNRWIRIQLVATILYICAQIDKSNIAVAFPGMRADLGLTATELGFAVGMFAWGYLALQIPVGRLTSAWSAKRTIILLGVCWSIVSATTALVQTETQLIVNRLMLGMSEGGILPAIVVVMRGWFTQRERARANLALLGTPIAAAIGNAVCGLAVSYVGWRLMFVVTAIPSLLWCAVWWWAVEDDPRQSAWLDPATKLALVTELDAEAQRAPVLQQHWFRSMWNPTVIILSIYNLLGLTAFWGLTFWLPTLLVEGGRTIGLAGVLASIPYVVSVGMAFLISASSDRMQERRWHLIVPTVLAGLFMCGAALFGEGHLLVLLFCLTMTTGLWFGRITIYWIMVADAVPRSVAGPSMAVANGIGNFGGFLGPLMFGWLRTTSGGFHGAMLIGGLLYVGAGLLAVLVQEQKNGRGANRMADHEAGIPKVVLAVGGQ
ncbi:MFS transporter [Acidisphaera sp. L21]|uniref:MFS transporter n=1 Tax=Acidisphaera sp. L21 TaxID=1641851 RepID=UPI00131A757E|nr:MFS transporter [Acidisphaera sp. L21]